MEHCITSIIQDDISALFVDDDFSVKNVVRLIEKIKDTIRSLNQLKLAAQGVIEFYEEERRKSSQLDKVLKQLENLIKE